MHAHTNQNYRIHFTIKHLFQNILDTVVNILIINMRLATISTVAGATAINQSVFMSLDYRNPNLCFKNSFPYVCYNGFQWKEGFIEKSIKMSIEKSKCNPV